MTFQRTTPLLPELLDQRHRVILRAVTGRGEEALAAFRTWRAMTPLDDIDPGTFRVVPLLVDLARRNAIEDPEIARMKGVVRHIWATNVLRLRQLFAALDALEGAGIRTMLLKGAALLARQPDIAAKRAFADYDILVEPQRITDAGRVLEAAGFSMLHFQWDDLYGDLPRSVTAGVPISMQGRAGEIDLHWRPVWSIYDAALVRRVFAGAERIELGGRRVLVPSPSHHLFMAIARCEPWDTIECFNRLMEGHFLLSGSDPGVNWDELKRLVEYYGLEAMAHEFLGVLAADTSVHMPPALISRFSGRLSEDKLRAWRLSALPPSQRRPLQTFIIERENARHRRADPAVRPLTRRQASLMEACRDAASLFPIWRLAHHRFEGPSTGLPRFLSGFSFPEAEGRWTGERWAFLAVPLTHAQQHGEPIRLNALVYPGGRARTHVVATAGVDTCQCEADGWTADISLQAKPLPRLGGDALIMFWLPDAISPFEAGESQDRRLLGLFLKREWQSQAAAPAHQVELLPREMC